MENLRAAEKTLKKDIKNMIESYGTVGLHVSVMEKGDIVFSYGSGHRRGLESPKSRKPFEKPLSRDQYPVNEKTIFGLCSLTKAVVAAGLALFCSKDGVKGVRQEERASFLRRLGVSPQNASDTLFNWKTPIKKLVPELFELQNKYDLGICNPQMMQHYEKITLHHLLTHTSGLARGDFQWYGPNNSIRCAEPDILNYLAFREIQNVTLKDEYHQYTNDGWMLAGYILDKVVHENMLKAQGMKTEAERVFGKCKFADDEKFWERYGEKYWPGFIKERIFDPLGMTRTTFGKLSSAWEENAAHGYNVIWDKKVNIGRVTAGDYGFAGASTGLKSCAEDMCKFYQACLSAKLESDNSRGPRKSNGCLVRIGDVMTGQVPMPNSQNNKDSSKFGYGWIQATLPNPLDRVGLNEGQAPLPTVGQGLVDGENTVFYHQGSFMGSLTCVILDIRHELVVLVLSNSLAQVDVASFVAQMTYEAGKPGIYPKNNYLKIAESFSMKWRTKQQQLGKRVENLKKSLKQKTSCNPGILKRYEGTYWQEPFRNAPRTKDRFEFFKIAVGYSESDGSLYVTFNGASKNSKFPQHGPVEMEKFKLEYIGDCTFFIFQDVENFPFGVAGLGLWVYASEYNYKFEFEKECDDTMVLWWDHHIDPFMDGKCQRKALRYIRI